MSWRSDLIASMTRDEMGTVLALIAGGTPEAFDSAFGALHGSLKRMFEEAHVPECRHCGALIRRCEHAEPNPLCKGWRHVGYDSQPVIGHCCGGRSINPAAEPGEEGSDG